MKFRTAIAVPLAVLGSLGLISVSTCSSPTPLSPIESPPGFFYFTERPLAWSPDGQYVVFQRFVQSTDGPPGIYVISVTGGRARFVTPFSLAGPRQVRMSPDNKSLVATYIAEVRLIDIATGESHSPFYASVEAVMPDWSPDGNRIVHERGSGAIPDSGGLHIYDIRTHRDRPLLLGPGRDGIYPRWLSENCIVYFHLGTTYRLAAVDTNGNDYRVLYEAPALRDLQTFKRGREGPKVLFSHFNQTFVTGPRAGLEQIRPMKFYEHISPDGKLLLTVRRSQRDTTWVVYVEELWVQHPRFRELTHFSAVE